MVTELSCRLASGDRKRIATHMPLRLPRPDVEEFGAATATSMCLPTGTRERFCMNCPGEETSGKVPLRSPLSRTSEAQE
jgi:hypothetical protein